MFLLRVVEREGQGLELARYGYVSPIPIQILVGDAEGTTGGTLLVFRQRRFVPRGLPVSAFLNDRPTRSPATTLGTLDVRRLGARRNTEVWLPGRLAVEARRRTSGVDSDAGRA